MKRYYFACKAFFLLCSICVVCNGSVDSKLLSASLAIQTATTQTTVVYQPKEVDVKAIVDKRKMKYPTGRDCIDSEVKVVLRAVLHSSGKVTDVEILEDSSCKNFQNAAIGAARKLKFIPAKKNGIAVSQYQELEYNYSFQNKTK